MSEPAHVVILDDYQEVALECGPWERLDGRCDVRTLAEHVAEADDLVQALAGAPVVVAMRERTSFDAERLARLPDLRLLVTTGMANAAIDLEAAAANGVVVCGTGGGARAPPGPGRGGGRPRAAALPAPGAGAAGGGGGGTP